MPEAEQKIISGQQTGAFEIWELPDVGVSSRSDHGSSSIGGTGDGAEGYEDGFARGQEEGRRQGLAAGQVEIQEQQRRLDEQLTVLAGILTALNQPMRQLDDALVAQVAELAVIIARQLVRRALKTDPGEIVALVREALSLLPVAARDITVRLEPEDVALVRKGLTMDEHNTAINLVADPSISRGGCRVETDISQIDASVDVRLAAVFAGMLDDERG